MKRMIFNLLPAVALAAGLAPGLAGAAPEAGPRVTLSDGALAGVRRGDVDVFYAIPYAAPPVGPLRFAPPQPPAKWRGLRDATRPAAPCPQDKTADPASERSRDEDCLYLNVSRPKAQGRGAQPVILWLHGGGWSMGWTGAVQYDATRLARATGAVVVSVGYRLGALGLFDGAALGGDPRDRGNLLLRDQLAAMRWVRANVARFGGDPKRVVLAGESAGANSILALLASPQSEGLISGAIVQSPVEDAHALPQAVAEGESGAAFVAAVGCNTAKDQAACLRALPLDKIMAARVRFTLVHGEAVLPADPYAAFASGNFVKVPVIVGSNLHEAYLFAAGTEAALGHAMTPADYAEAAAKTFGRIAPAVLAEYPASAHSSPSAALGDALGDARFACYAGLARRDMAAHTAVYGYELSREGGTQQQPLRQPSVLPNTAYHTSDLGYLFDADRGGAPIPGSERDMVAFIQSAWGLFARTGSPAGPGLPAWPRMTAARPAILSIGAAKVPVSDFWQRHHCDFWAALGIVSANGVVLSRAIAR